MKTKTARQISKNVDYFTEAFSFLRYKTIKRMFSCLYVYTNTIFVCVHSHELRRKIFHITTIIKIKTNSRTIERMNDI